MKAGTNNKPSRQVKALFSLVISMTLGTALLNWVHDLSPARTSATPLRSTPARQVWDSIIVETIATNGLRADGSAPGFHHLHVDRRGQVIESAAWKREERDRRSPSAIRIVVSVDPQSSELTPRQWKRLSDVFAHLQTVHEITRDRIRVEPRRGEASAPRARLDAMIRTR